MGGEGCSEVWSNNGTVCIVSGLRLWGLSERVLQYNISKAVIRWDYVTAPPPHSPSRQRSRQLLWRRVQPSALSLTNCCFCFTAWITFNSDNWFGGLKVVWKTSRVMWTIRYQRLKITWSSRDQDKLGKDSVILKVCYIELINEQVKVCDNFKLILQRVGLQLFDLMYFFFN